MSCQLLRLKMELYNIIYITKYYVAVSVLQLSISLYLHND